MEHPELIPPDEEQRLEAVRRYAVLDSPPDGAFDRIANLPGWKSAYDLLPDKRLKHYV